jgi:hypothetical protein
MTRKDWWLGILVILIALIIQTMILARITRPDALVAKVRPLASTEFVRR